MGKRSTSEFERKPRDLYPTPYEPCVPLFRHLAPRTRFIEPCAGDGRLIGHIQSKGHICVGAFDIEPQDPCIKKADALDIISVHQTRDIHFITNPPWERKLLHRLIIHLSSMHPTWMLLDMNWANTQQAAPYLERCRKIVVVGRVKWIEGSKHQGKDDAGWFLFTAARGPAIEFYGRVAK